VAEESRKKDEIRRGKQVEATPENDHMSDMEFEPGATFSREENEKVAMVLERMEVVLATVPDRHFGSGSGSKPNRCQIGGPGRQ